MDLGREILKPVNGFLRLARGIGQAAVDFNDSKSLAERLEVAEEEHRLSEAQEMKRIADQMGNEEIFLEHAQIVALLTARSFLRRHESTDFVPEEEKLALKTALYDLPEPLETTLASLGLDEHATATLRTYIDI